MTPEAQNIAIAESIGWTILTGPDISSCCACYATDPNGVLVCSIRNYTGSLDACAEFEAKLEREQRFRYVVVVGHLVKAGEKHQDGFTFTIMTAPAAIRCEAYLRTIGKWQESN